MKRQRDEQPKGAPVAADDFVPALTAITNTIRDLALAAAPLRSLPAVRVLADLNTLLDTHDVDATSTLFLDERGFADALCQHAFHFGLRTPLTDVVFQRTGLWAITLLHDVDVSLIYPNVSSTSVKDLLADVGSGITPLSDRALTLLADIVAEHSHEILELSNVTDFVGAIDTYLVAVNMAISISTARRLVSNIIENLLHNASESVPLCHAIVAADAVTHGFTRLVKITEPDNDELLIALAHVCLVVTSVDASFAARVVPLMLPHIELHFKKDDPEEHVTMACHALAACDPAIAAMMANSPVLLEAIVGYVCKAGALLAQGAQCRLLGGIEHFAASIEHLCAASPHARSVFGTADVVKSLCQLVDKICAGGWCDEMGEFVLGGLLGVAEHCSDCIVVREHASLIVTTCVKALAGATSIYRTERLRVLDWLSYTTRSLPGTAVLTMHMAVKMGGTIGDLSSTVLEKAFNMVTIAIAADTCQDAHTLLGPVPPPSTSSPFARPTPAIVAPKMCFMLQNAKLAAAATERDELQQQIDELRRQVAEATAGRA